MADMHRLYTLIVILFVNSGFHLVLSHPFERISREIPRVPMPEVSICTAMPGTTEWNECWSKFSRSFQTFGARMAEFSRAMNKQGQEMQEKMHKELGDATSLVKQNGYKLRTKYLPVSSYVSDRMIRFEIKNVQTQESPVEIDREMHGLKWKGPNTFSEPSWFTLEVPQEISLDAVTYTQRDSRLLIDAPEPSSTNYSRSSNIIMSS